MWYLKHYQCSECGHTWSDEWDCLCNDRCPTCRAETEPYAWRELCQKQEPPSSGVCDDLLDACEQMLSEMRSRFDYEVPSESESAAMRLAEDAIAKAKGWPPLTRE